MTAVEERVDGASVWRRLGDFALRALRVELRIYASIGRLIARRPAIPIGGSGFSYHRPVLTILVIFIVLSAVEIPIIDLIVHRWPAVRIGLLVLGIWGLTWMVGLLAAFLTRPHTVGPEGIRVREGLEIDVPLSWSEIASIAIDRRVDEPKSPRFADDGVMDAAPEASWSGQAPAEVSGARPGRTLSLRMQDETNIEIELERPTPVRLPGRPPKGGVQAVTRVRLWTDDPKGFLAAARRHLGAYAE
ncbi:hypothetical protein GE115_13235 [Agromyces sp. CFH 90414]|uniref:PH domain-containing protein n=1 Tax=Agromyces agglutinans TaxID=2662258 RepID=A0A6I2F7R1_9MICO|nr:hypothetical protein [Agromyces agglutinans]MRG60822.1 hypothetical protein [Agromyces agglutinans]